MVMKVRVSASIEKETDTVLDKIMQTGKYRNKSHAIEKAIILLEEEEVRQAKASRDSKK
jgi:Arc/MetJ-type ribon-helix-helix transcriptional regulator